MSHSNLASSVWFITGCSTGMGRHFALTLLSLGQKVIATARNIDRIRDIEQAGAAIMTVDVTWSPEKLKEVATNAIEVYGRVDYLINNAGYTCQGAIEEVSHQETYDIFNTNVFGVLNVTRSFLPHYRQRRSGGIIIISSTASRWYHSGITIYSATKAALSSLGEGLKAEVEPLGIKVLTIDLGHFRTPALKRDTNLKRAAQVITDYKPINGWFEEYVEKRVGNEPNDPKLGVLRVIEIITQSGMATGREVPARILLGADGKEPFVKMCRDTVKQIEEWSDVICSTSY
ncbi:short-chain dehydrogenases reductases (SDR) family [Rhizoctonia solani]|uniref:Short-chain dehydrogenases reductases (SDR) family n=1 Tax=Rhizoctonia solani TaxID=456999 RepID=A0A8H7LIV0_9AGAM|nr:short-chain dehydrogenases reductases (SDR) family [Rhizoctonia solani]